MWRKGGRWSWKRRQWNSLVHAELDYAKQVSELSTTLSMGTGSNCTSFSSDEMYYASFCADMREHQTLLLPASAVRYRTPEVFVHTVKVRCIQTVAIFLQHLPMKQPLKIMQNYDSWSLILAHKIHQNGLTSFMLCRTFTRESEMTCGKCWCMYEWGKELLSHWNTTVNVIAATTRFPDSVSVNERECVVGVLIQ